MSEKRNGQASQRKPSTNKNIKKLRTISMVCSLANSWQQWVAENESKQASEPSGWAPASSLGGPEEPEKKWVPKKPLPVQTQQTEAPTAQRQTSTSKTDEVKTSDEPPVVSCIKTKQVVKTVTSSVQEKSAGVGLLTEKIKRERLPSDEEIDRMLKKKNSPTRRRKCSNMVSSLTKSWKQVENEQKLVKEGGGPREALACGDKGDSGPSEVDKEGLEVEEAQTPRASFSKEAEQKKCEEDSETAVRIKRSSAPV